MAADDPIILPPITLAQLNTISAALKLAEVRYPLLLQLPRWEKVPPLSHDDLGDLAETLSDLAAEMGA